MRLGLGLTLGIPGNQRNDEPVPVKYMFIDAASLHARLRKFSQRYSDGVDLHFNWPLVGGGHEKVFYYDALPGKKKDEGDAEFSARLEEAERLHIYLQTLDRYRVYQGDVRWRSGRGNEQKKVDVMITVDMIKHTIRKNMDQATLFASDVDFRPLLDALVDEGMFVTLIYNPLNTSQELLGAADARIALTPGKIYSWLDEESSKKVGFISEVAYGDTRKGPLLETFEHPKVGLIEVRAQGEGEGGWGAASHYCQWREKGKVVWTQIGAGSAELAKLVALEIADQTKPI